MRKKSFTHEFKQECVNLVLQHKYPVNQPAETMNIGLSTFQPFNLSTFQPYNLTTLQPYNLTTLATVVSRRDPRKHTDSQCYNTGTTANTRT
ncbi:Transposase [Yersinia entomophaga]